jgi:hypothetical protein
VSLKPSWVREKWQNRFAVVSQAGAATKPQVESLAGMATWAISVLRIHINLFVWYKFCAKVARWQQEPMSVKAIGDQQWSG